MAKLNEEIVKALKSPDVVKRFADQGLDADADDAGAVRRLHEGRGRPLGALVKASGATVD